MARKDLRERLRNALLGVRVVRAFMGLAQAEAKRVGLWNDIPWLFSWLYRICWFLAAVAILFLPALPDEPFIYFPAILAVATAWLFTAPRKSLRRTRLSRSNRQWEPARIPHRLPTTVGIDPPAARDPRLGTSAVARAPRPLASGAMLALEPDLSESSGGRN